MAIDLLWPVIESSHVVGCRALGVKDVLILRATAWTAQRKANGRKSLSAR